MNNVITITKPADTPADVRSGDLFTDGGTSIYILGKYKNGPSASDAALYYVAIGFYDGNRWRTPSTDIADATKGLTHMGNAKITVDFTKERQ